MYLVWDEGSFSIFMILFCLLLSTLLCILMYLSCAYDSYMSSLFSDYDIALVRATTRSSIPASNMSNRFRWEGGRKCRLGLLEKKYMY